MIYGLSESEALEQIASRKLTIGVVGVGTIGLPTATFFAKAGFRVLGFDVSQERVDSINGKTVSFEYSDMLKSLKTPNFEATVDMKRLREVDAMFVCVPTPLDENKNIKLDFVMSAARNIGTYGKKGLFAILESSVNVGASRTFGAEIEKASGMKAGIDFGLAYCPERYNPRLPQENQPHISYGNGEDTHFFTLDKVPRVVGGMNSKSTAIAKALYECIISTGVKPVSSMEAAEATKLLENIFRDVNIGLVNEMSGIFAALNLDTFEIINAAKTKPFAFLPHYPGPGVGGECIPVDTWYLIKQAESLGIKPELMLSTRKVNDSMPSHVIGLVKSAFAEAKKDIRGSRICVLGVSYKKNIGDTRVTPAKPLIEMLSADGADVHACDPFVSKPFYKALPVEKALDAMDCIILVTDHDIFKTLKLDDMKMKLRTPIVIDTRNFFDGTALKKGGFIYRGVGKPVSI
jgi:nucleotide sugar dehydrogenase